MFKIVVVGNCQAKEVMIKLKLALRTQSDVCVDWVWITRELTAQDRVNIAESDLVIEQIGSFEDIRLEIGAHSKQQHIFFPALTLNYLWPLGLQAHPKNQVDEYWNPGPFPMQHGNQWLNRRLLNGDPHKAIAEDYEVLNVARIGPIDRLRKIDEARWALVEKKTNIMFVDSLRQELRSRRAFHAPLHPSTAVIDIIVAGILECPPFGNLNLSDWQGGRDSFFRMQPPIHTTVAAYLDLNWVENSKFNLWNVGPLSQKEWIMRYIEFNPGYKLRSILMAVRAEKDPSIKLESLLPIQSEEPLSADLQVAIGLAYLDLKAPVSALPHIEKAVEIWPNETESLFAYIKVLFQLKRIAEAARVCEHLSAVDPYHIGAVMVLNRIARQDKTIELAKSTAERMKSLQPQNERVIEAVSATENLLGFGLA